MNLQEQMQSALEKLVQSAQRLDEASGIIEERQKEAAELKEQCRILRAALEEAEAERDAALEAESELETLKSENEELVSARNRLVAEKNHLLEEQEQFNQDREGWEQENAALLQARTDAEKELQRLRERLSMSSQGDKRIDTPLIPRNKPAEQDGEHVDLLNEEDDRLNGELAHADEQHAEWVEENERLSIELDGLKQAYEELKQIAREASERLDSTLEELKILRG